MSEVKAGDSQVADLNEYKSAEEFNLPLGVIEDYSSSKNS